MTRRSRLTDIKWICLLALVMTPWAMSGCASVDEDIVLQPTSQLAASSIGDDQRVGLRVVDERPSRLIGHRGPTGAAEIRTSQDIREVVDDAVARGLKKRGFEPVPLTHAERATLNVEIRDFTYEATAGFWTSDIRTRAALKAIAQNNGDTLALMYRTEDKERVIFGPSESSDAKQLNHSLSTVIDRLLGDQRLLHFLAVLRQSRGEPTASGANTALAND